MKKSSVAPALRGKFGVFATAEEACAAAQEAFLQLKEKGIAARRKIEEIIKTLAEKNAEQWGRIELEETKIGRLDHKIAKLQIIKLVPGVIAFVVLQRRGSSLAEKFASRFLPAAVSQTKAFSLAGDSTFSSGSGMCPPSFADASEQRRQRPGRRQIAGGVIQHRGGDQLGQGFAPALASRRPEGPLLHRMHDRFAKSGSLAAVTLVLVLLSEIEKDKRDADALFWATPPGYGSDNVRAFQNRLGIAGSFAIRDNNISHVVNLSSIGAQLSNWVQGSWL